MKAYPSCCVIVPLYKQTLSDDEALSLLNTVHHCPDYSIRLLHPPHCQRLVDQLIAWFDHPSLQGHCLPERHFDGIAAYNRLLLSSDFYGLFQAFEWILIVQLDALLLGGDLAGFLDQPYAYWGAPFFLGLDRPIRPLRLLGGGNGGFSLRRVRLCQSILARRHWLYPAIRRFEHESLPGQPWRATVRALRQLLSFGGCGAVPPMLEDLFWSFIAPKLDADFQVAPAEKAMYFALETESGYLASLMNAYPFGCHAWRRHSPLFWQQYFAQKPELIGPALRSRDALLSHLGRAV
jgi:hypothetical protein